MITEGKHFNTIIQEYVVFRIKEKALFGICKKQIEIDASTQKAVRIERIIQVSEDIQDELADRIQRKTLPIPIHAKCRISYA